MPSRPWLIAGLLLLAAPSLAPANTSPAVLFAFGPGGPHSALKACAEQFHERHGTKVVVLNAKPEHLAERLAAHGDLYFAGAEYMLHEFDRDNPGLLDLSSAELLHPRRIGLIVRKGNPLGIEGIEDLGQEGLNLLAAELEEMDPFHPPSPNGKHRHHLVRTGRHGLAAWRSRPELDAWVTYRSWHVALGDEADFVEIPGDHALRHTPVAPTRRTPHRPAVLQFIEYLRSPEARLIFEDHGWY